ncbi:hypothetical protein BANRA_03819 [Klebsiella pneumoniae]|nr:hypothetical protein BANRA_03819 [Klebsiella pneumoniae]
MANIAWFIPQLIEGSGGHRTMLQHAAYLEKMGHTCTIYLEDKSGKTSGAEVIHKLFGLNLKTSFMTGIMRNHVMLQLQQYGILHHSWPLYHLIVNVYISFRILKLTSTRWAMLT